MRNRGRRTARKAIVSLWRLILNKHSPVEYRVPEWLPQGLTDARLSSGQ
jgi:hypothetical protein